MSTQWEPVAIPFAAGISPSTQPRLLPSTKLLRAENCYYKFSGGPQKRRGHTIKQVVTKDNPVALNGVTYPGDLPAPAYRANYSTANPGLPSTWLYGWGILDQPIPAADTRDAWAVSEHREAGLLFGQTVRDNEVVAWDGHRAFSYAPNQASLWGETYSPANRGPACMPMMRAQPLAKTATAQLSPGGADTGVVRAVAWLSPGNIVNYSVFDSKSGACLLANGALTMNTVLQVRVLAVGPWVHILISDTGTATIERRSFHQEAPSTIISQSIGNTNTGFFDVTKFSETGWFTAIVNAGVITISQRTAEGILASTPWVPNLGGHPASNVAIAINTSNTIGLLWIDSGTFAAYFATFGLGGSVITSAQVAQIGTSANNRITLAPNVVQQLNGSTPVDVWDTFRESLIGGTNFNVAMYRVLAGVSTTALYARYNTVLASHAFRVGNRTFMWCGSPSILQACWYLCDAHLLPVGRLDYGTANVSTSLTNPLMPGVNWHTDDVAHPAKDRVVFHGTLGYKQRVSTAQTSMAPNGVFAEPSIKFFELDFLPSLQTAQAGRTTYFAGAQLWAYDGAEFNEATMPMAPELTSAPGQTTGGALTLTGTYRYRIDLCHKNAQNEEVRGWSLISAATTLTASNNKITLTINTVPFTRREDAYFLIYRNESNGVNWYLVSSRDPTDAKFTKNNQTASTVSFVDDTISDTVLIGREYHPANAGGNYLDPLPAPACELVSVGRDRLWVAGGELSPGEVAPSRYFAPGITPTFSPGLNIQVDRNVEPITAIGFVGEIGVIFRQSTTYILDGDGPDNTLTGGWNSPRLAAADIGAISSNSLILAAPGLFFQSSAGIRLMSPTGQINFSIGEDVENIAIGMNIASAVVNVVSEQVRWYARTPTDPTLVLDYSTGVWTTWTGLDCIGASIWRPANNAILTKSNGYLWVETQDKWLDGDRAYEMVVKTAWLHSDTLVSFQRIRRFALFGLAPGTHTNRIRVFYNEKPAYSQEITVAVPGTSGGGNLSEFNTAMWGSAATWGSGSWGDEENLPSGLFFRNGVFRFRRRLNQQKCSVISFEFSDQGANSAGFIPVVLALEVGKQGGIDRIPSANTTPA